MICWIVAHKFSMHSDFMNHNIIILVTSHGNISLASIDNYVFCLYYRGIFLLLVAFGAGAGAAWCWRWC